MDDLQPGFDLAMELLCTVPCEPRFAAVSDVIADFPIEEYADVAALIETLAERRYYVELRTAPRPSTIKGRVLFIHKCNWPVCEQAAERYWQNVYGQNTQAQGLL